MDTPPDAAGWARTCLGVLHTTYPYGTAHVTRSASDHFVDPTLLHPSFHGALDWHSSCHMQWSLVTLLPHLPGELAAEVITLLDARLTTANLGVEADYLRTTPAYERPYGWAWALMLESTLRTSPLHVARAWAAAAGPLADVVEENIVRWVTSHPLPVRHGVHSNSAFALSLVLHAGRRSGRTLAADAARDAALRWFQADDSRTRGAEPSGTDFLSPTLSEAELMSHVLPPAAAREWLAGFLAPLASDDPILAPPPAVDDSDGHLAHLNGLALSRAWQLRTIAPLLDGESARVARASADRQYQRVAPLISDGDFMSTHWLVSFALLAVGALCD